MPAEPPVPKRRLHDRCTAPVTSNLTGEDLRWWNRGHDAFDFSSPRRRRSSSSKSSASSRRHPEQRHAPMRFHSPDPFDRYRWLRHSVVIFSIFTPLVILARYETLRHMRAPHEAAIDAAAKAEALPVFEPTISLRKPTTSSTSQDVGKLMAECAKNPNQPDTIRALAEASAVEHPAQARRCYEQLDKLGATTPADRAGHAMVLAQLHDFNGAKSILSKVAPDAVGSEVVLRAWLALGMESQDYTVATSALEKLQALNPEDVDTALGIATTAAAHAAPESTISRLEHLALTGLHRWMDSGRLADVGLRLPKLLALPLANTDDRTLAVRLLRAQAGAQYRFAAIRLSYPPVPNGEQMHALRDAWTDEIRWNGGLSVPDKDSVAAYLQGQDAHDLVITLIADREALTEPLLMERRNQSLLQLGRWRDAGIILGKAKASAYSSMPRLTRALTELCERRLHRTASAEELVTATLNEARDQDNALNAFAAGCMAMDHGLHLLASRAFGTTFELSPDKGRTLTAIVSAARRSGLGAGQLLDSIDPLMPVGDSNSLPALDYLRLLAHRDVAAVAANVRSRRLEQPDDVYLRFLDAFAQHQMGDYTRATSTLIPLPQYRWHQGEAAVIAGILATTGKLDPTSALVSQVDTDRIFPEERQLITTVEGKRALRSNSLLGSIGDKLEEKE